MNNALRLFIAIDLPPEVKALLSQLQAQLRKHTDAVRWTDPNGTHLTLKFLGSVDAQQVDAVAEGMGNAARRHAPFTLQTTALGMFPNSKRPRVVWLGVGGDTQKLAKLHADVEHFIAPLGFPTEQRAFSPHLTLGRTIKEPTAAQHASIGLAVQQTESLGTVVFEVNEVVLMRSELTPRGARYTALHHARLDGLA